ncbi:hypothetical protein LBMAG56_43560 [Verrucomicrobiota bacterium]|nr:hypothetical protein LBMAG56_43560 [Verrucomicrobiota bacterium]
MDTDKQSAESGAAEGAPRVECGDLSPLSRRRLVAVNRPHASAPAREPALARAVYAPVPHRHLPRFDGDKSPRKSGDKSPHSKTAPPRRQRVATSTFRRIAKRINITRTKLPFPSVSIRG